MTTNGAATQYGIPRSTLRSKLRSGVHTIKARGPKRTLLDDDIANTVTKGKETKRRTQTKLGDNSNNEEASKKASIEAMDLSKRAVPGGSKTSPEKLHAVTDIDSQGKYSGIKV